jgi:outer membrane protein OmpA-like peptidoglycan-associated protein
VTGVQTCALPIWQEGTLDADWDDPSDAPTSNTVINCHIQRCGAESHGAVGVFAAFSTGTRIAHNLVHDMPYTGISIGYRWNTTATSQARCIVEYNHIHDVMKKLADESGGLFTWNSKLGMLQMQADLTFAPGSTEIKPEAAKALQKLAEYLNRAEFQPFNSYIAGHTDDMPLSKTETKELHGTNWGLSVHRSLAVIKLLAENRVDQARLAAMGFSKYHPVAPNAAGNKGNAANRRVEIWIVPREKFMTTGTPAEPTVSAEKEGS